MPVPAWVVSLVIGFIIRQITKYGESVDWAKVKKDAEAQIRAVLPAWLEQPFVDVAMSAIDVVAKALEQGADLKAIAEKLAAGDVAGALVLLKELIAKLVHPDSAIQSAVVAAVTDYEGHAPSAVA